MTTTQRLQTERAGEIALRAIGSNAKRRIAAGHSEAEALAGALAEFTDAYPQIGSAVAEALGVR